jgi:hypothetical protein
MNSSKDTLIKRSDAAEMHRATKKKKQGDGAAHAHRDDCADAHRFRHAPVPPSISQEIPFPEKAFVLFVERRRRRAG